MWLREHRLRARLFNNARLLGYQAALGWMPDQRRGRCGRPRLPIRPRSFCPTTMDGQT
jgi:hypothetical protein